MNIAKSEFLEKIRRGNIKAVYKLNCGKIGISSACEFDFDFIVICTLFHHRWGTIWNDLDYVSHDNTYCMI